MRNRRRNRKLNPSRANPFASAVAPLPLGFPLASELAQFRQPALRRFSWLHARNVMEARFVNFMRLKWVNFLSLSCLFPLMNGLTALL